MTLLAVVKSAARTAANASYSGTVEIWQTSAGYRILENTGSSYTVSEDDSEKLIYSFNCNPIDRERGEYTANLKQARGDLNI